MNKKLKLNLIRIMIITIFLISIFYFVLVFAEESLPQDNRLGTLTIGQTENQKLLKYDLDWAEVNIKLLKGDGTKDYSLAINDVFVTPREDSYKFGATDNLNSRIGGYKYTIESSSPIIENELRPYIYKTIKQEFYEVEERHEFWFYDICNKAFECSGEEENYSCEYYADCKFDYSTKEKDGKTIYVLEVSFNSDSLIDPTITIEDVATSVSQRIDTISENKFIHLNISENSPYNKLIFYMPFDTNTSTTSVYDYSKNNNDGTVAGNAVVNNTNCIYGDCLQLDGAGDYISVGTNAALSFPNNFTITAWVYRNTEITNQEFIASKDTTTRGFGFEIYKNRLSYERNGAWVISMDATTKPNFDINKSEWYFVAVAYNGTFTTYVNATKDASVTTTANPSNSVADFRIGARQYPGYEGYFNGSIDELMIFNTSLTYQQIQDIYNNQSARFKATGKAIFNEKLVVLTNEVNVTSDIQNLMGTNLSLTIYYKNSTGWFETSPQNITSNIEYNFTVVNASEINLSYEFISDSFQFYTPILQNNILVKYEGTEVDCAPKSRQIVKVIFA